MTTAPAFDWGALMRTAFGRLGLEPDRFWKLTPAELRMLLGEGAGLPAMTRDGLTAMMAAFPDDKEES